MTSFILLHTDSDRVYLCCTVAGTQQQIGWLYPQSEELCVLSSPDLLAEHVNTNTYIIFTSVLNFDTKQMDAKQSRWPKSVIKYFRSISGSICTQINCWIRTYLWSSVGWAVLRWAQMHCVETSVSLQRSAELWFYCSLRTHVHSSVYTYTCICFGPSF